MQPGNLSFLNFNPSQYDPSQSDGQLPKGNHLVQIIESKLKAASSGNGNQMAVLVMQIIEGDNAGVTGAMHLNIKHSNEKTQEISLNKLSAVCHVCGIVNTTLTSTEMLHNRPFKVEVVEDPEDERYTKIKKILDVNGMAPRRGMVPQQPPNQQALPPQNQAQQPANQQGWPQQPQPQGQWGQQQTSPQPQGQQGWNQQIPPPQHMQQQQPQQQYNTQWNAGGPPPNEPF